MHSSRFVHLLALISLPLASISSAQTVADDFSAGTNWAAPTLDGAAQFAISGGRANYTTPNAVAGSDNSAFLRWTQATYSYTSDWEVQVDVHARAASTGTPFDYFYGELAVVRTGDTFGAFNASDAPLYNSLSAQIIRPGGATNAFQTGHTISGGGNFEFPENGLGFASGSMDAALRIAFNSTTKTLTTYYDADGAAGGYTWTAMTSIDVDGAQNWSMTGASTFTLALSVFSGSDRFAGGDIYFDNLSVTTAPTFTTPPQSSAAAAGGSVTLTAAAGGSGHAFQWSRNGTPVAGATATSLTVANLQPEHTGIYTVAAASGGLTTASAAAIVGLRTTAKVVGTGTEIAANIPHPNTNVFDQVLLQGTAATITADASINQITRLSFIDLQNDIVQVEFAGAGTLSIVLDGSSGPAAPVNYNQPTVSYMKGHAGIVVTGADETTNLSIFTVGRATAFDPTGVYNILLPPGPTNLPANNGSSLFQGHSATVYDGIADIAFVAISGTNGKFGGLRTSNTSYWNTKGLTGVYAPGVAFQGPVFIHDIDASDTATPMLVIGSGSDTRITGGSLLQSNGKAVQVAGLTSLQFTGGTTSHNTAQAAKANQGRLEENGVDVTSQLVPAN